MRLIFDIETDGLIPEMTVVHSLVIKDVDTGVVYSCTDHSEYVMPEGLMWTDIASGLRMLMVADMIVGHNIIKFDIPAIQKIYPWFKPQGLVRDTLVLSRLIWANMYDADEAKARKATWLPKHLWGRHSLESWGDRLGCWKGDYSKEKSEEARLLGLKGDAVIRFVWGTWNQEMQDYCVQDVAVTEILFKRCYSKGFSEESIQLEHLVATIIDRQERYGFSFDEPKAHALYGKLLQEKHDTEQQLKEVFKPWYRRIEDMEPTLDRQMSNKELPPIGYETRKDGTLKLDKEGNPKPIYFKTTYTAGAKYTKVKLLPFNPGSRHDIANRLKFMFNWEPSEFTPDGSPKVDEETLSSLPWVEAKLLTRYMLIQKRLGQIADGKEAWFRHVRNGRIHGGVNTNGAVTGRMTHSRPNMAQVPGNGAPFGHDCRELFYAPKGKMLVGCDADALELRDLAGYMAAFDGGRYIKTVLEGNKDDGTDMHTLNAKALGCSRAVAKVWFYAFIYGAGNGKLGSILGAEGGPRAVIAAGKDSRTKFLRALPALKKLVERVKEKAENGGKLKGLDGRVLYVRSAHAALNTLLQSAGAIQMKRGLCILDETLQAAGLIPGVNYEFVGNIHDEWQIEVDEDKADFVGQTAADAIRRAGEYYEFRCPLAGNYEKGRTWADTH